MICLNGAFGSFDETLFALLQSIFYVKNPLPSLRIWVNERANTRCGACFCVNNQISGVKNPPPGSRYACAPRYSFSGALES